MSLETLGEEELRELRRAIDSVHDEYNPGSGRGNGGDGGGDEDDEDENDENAEHAPQPFQQQHRATKSSTQQQHEINDALDHVNLRLRRLGFQPLEVESVQTVVLTLLEVLPEYERRGKLISKLIHKLGNSQTTYNVVERLYREQTVHQRSFEAEETARAKALLAEARAQVEQSEATRTELAAQLERTTQQCNDDLQRISQQLQETQDRDAAVHAELQAANEKQAADLRRQSSELRTVQAQIAQRDVDLRTLQAQLAQRDAELQTAVHEKQTANADLQRVQTELARAQASRGEARAQLDQLHAEMQALQDRSSASTEVHKLRRQVQQLKDELASSAVAASSTATSAAPAAPLFATSTATAASAGDESRERHYRAITKNACKILHISSASKLPATIEQIVKQRSDLETTLVEVQNVVRAIALTLPLPPLSVDDDHSADVTTTLVRISSAITRMKEEQQQPQYLQPSPPLKSSSSRRAPVFDDHLPTLDNVSVDSNSNAAKKGSGRAGAGAGAGGAETGPYSSTSGLPNLDTPFRELFHHFRRLFEIRSKSPEVILASMNELYIERTELQAALKVARRVLNLDPSAPILHVIERLERLRA